MTACLWGMHIQLYRETGAVWSFVPLYVHNACVPQHSTFLHHRVFVPKSYSTCAEQRGCRG